MKPVAWAMFKNNTFMDAIHPDEHTRFEGGYTIPLYTHPAELTDEEIWKLWVKHLNDDIIVFARALLKKASVK